MPSKEDAQLAIGQRIKSIRLEKGLTQIDLASRANKDQQSIQRLEAGRINPTYFYLLQISEALDISMSELLNF